MDFEGIGSLAGLASGIPGIGTAASGVLGGIGALGGLLGASAKRKREEEARQRALVQLSAQLDQDYNNLVQSHARTISEQGGYAGDAIRALGSNLGAANAAAGVTNNSAVAGSNAIATDNTQKNLAELGARNRESELGMLGENKRYLTGLQFNLGGENFNNAALRENQAAGGLMSFLGKLGQQNLQNNGAPTARNMNTSMNGTQGSVIDMGAQPGQDFNMKKFLDQYGSKNLSTAFGF